MPPDHAAEDEFTAAAQRLASSVSPVVARAARAARAFEGLDRELHRLGSRELEDLLRVADQVTAWAAAARVAVAAEASWRGIPGAHGQRTAEWVRQHASSTRQGGVFALARLADDAARAARRGRLGAPASGSEAEPAAVPVETSVVAGGLDPESALGVVWSDVRSGRTQVPLAGAVLRQMKQLEPRLKPEAVGLVTRVMNDVGVELGSRSVEALRARLLADHGLAGEIDKLHDKLAASAYLSQPELSPAELTEYRLVLTPEQSALLEAAIGPLSAPAHDPETNEPDTRSAGQRRAEALVGICTGAIGVDGQKTASDGVAGSAMALVVTMNVDDLREGLGCGEVQATRASGMLLSPSQIRRHACDCDIIPAVLGGPTEVLDWGRVHRLFTPAQRRRIWHRDRHCTYPGCTAPATWTRVHHIRHWLDGGPTDLTNAALLCQLHHTFVHQGRLWATVLDKADECGRFVIWDLTPGSYDSAVAGGGP